MARSATFNILISYEAYERFAAIIRPLELADREAAQLKPEFDIERGFGRTDSPGQSHLWEQSGQGG